MVDEMKWKRGIISFAAHHTHHAFPAASHALPAAPLHTVFCGLLTLIARGISRRPRVAPAHRDSGAVVRYNGEMVVRTRRLVVSRHILATILSWRHQRIAHR